MAVDKDKDIKSLYYMEVFAVHYIYVTLRMLDEKENVDCTNPNNRR